MPIGTNTVLLTVSDSASNQTTRAVAVIVPGDPRIVLQPADLTVVAGSNANFSVLACGPLRCFTNGSTSAQICRSATNAVLALTNVQDAAAGSYTVLRLERGRQRHQSPALLTVLDSAGDHPAAACCTISRAHAQPLPVVASGTAPPGLSVAERGREHRRRDHARVSRSIACRPVTPAPMRWW